MRFFITIIFISILVPITASELPKCHSNNYRNNCYGTFTWDNSSTYTGEWKNNELDGYGTMLFFDGRKYVGEWKKSNWHGHGKATFPSGETYVGNWKNNKRHGYGISTWPDGSTHKGEYLNDEENGYGITIWSNGSSYEGEFKDGVADGQGTAIYADGRVLKGQWKKNKWVSGKKYSIEEYKDITKADNNNHQNSTNQKALEKERRKSLEEKLKREKAEKEKEQIERELAELKKQKKKEKKRISTDIDHPHIVIDSINVQNKQGIIEGKVTDNIEVAELTIDGKKVNISNNGKFMHKLFVPKGGIKVTVEATDGAGLTSKETITLDRNEIEQTKVFKFSKLNPLNIKGKKDKNSLALIIGISKYSNAPEAKYADRDANYFSDFAESVLGIQENNIKLISNSSASNIALKKALKIWLKGYSTPDKSDIYIFFAGHGLASNDGKDLYLLPYDGEPRLLEDTALLRSEIFNIVKGIEPKSVTVFLDACYSGLNREKEMILTDVRPITIVPNEKDVPENFTLFSASSGSEISGSLPEAYHGLFSYFLMKGLEGDADVNKDKRITNGELHTYVHSNVTRQALRLGREQTPQLQGDESRVLVDFN